MLVDGRMHEDVIVKMNGAYSRVALGANWTHACLSTHVVHYIGCTNVTRTCKSHASGASLYD